METKTKKENSAGVDEGLVAAFLRMSPEERLSANDRMARTILEIRNAFQKQKAGRNGPERHS
jgi:hypothetical protein